MEYKNRERNIQQFNGERYGVWKFRIRALLAERGLLAVIDEEVPESPSKEWVQKDHLATSTIIEYLGDAFLCYVKDKQSAKNIFSKLDTMYERRGLAAQVAIRKQLLSLKLESHVPLIKHFMQFDLLITELVFAGAKVEEIDKVSLLLLTLPTTYDGVIMALDTLNVDTLTLDFVKHRLLDQEVLQTFEQESTTGSNRSSGSSSQKWKSFHRGRKWKKGFRSNNY